jgi:hypothetical protein
MEYVHQELGQDIQSISGTYTPMKELRLPEDGRDVLCVIGMAVVDTACCGSGSFVYATVPGYIVSWKDGKGPAGGSVSQVEPITDDAAKREISRVLRETEGIYNVNFW